MERTIFSDEHEALRASVREFLDRQVRPRHEEFIEARAIPRDVWVEAGRPDRLQCMDAWAPSPCGVASRTRQACGVWMCLKRAGSSIWCRFISRIESRGDSYPTTHRPRTLQEKTGLL